MSISATRSRTARCSAPIASNAGPRSNDGVSTAGVPGGANQFGRSQPNLLP